MARTIGERPVESGIKEDKKTFLLLRSKKCQNCDVSYVRCANERRNSEGQSVVYSRKENTKAK